MPDIVLHPKTITERLKQSLFAIPFVCLIVGAVAGELSVRADQADLASWLPSTFETSTANGRAVLTAIATGMITVVTLVLTLTLVAIQLAAGQLSPRTIMNFLGDRFQQATVGVVLATAAFSLLALRAVSVTANGDAPTPGLTALIAIAATMASLGMLVMSVDRTANRLAVGTLVRDVAQETCALIEQRYGGEQPVAGERPTQFLTATHRTDSSPSPPEFVVDADRAGWVQAIDEATLLKRVPEGAVIEFLHPVGTFVFEGMAVVQISGPPSDDDRDHLAKAIVIGDQRTMQQDVSFGLTRLVDIGLRALSPGVNDPNTAREVILRLGQVILSLQAHELDTEFVEIDHRHVVRHGAPTHDAFVRDAFDQIRRAADDDVATLSTIVNTLDLLEAEARRQGYPGGRDEIRRQRSLAGARLARIDDSPWPPTGDEPPERERSQVP